MKRLFLILAIVGSLVLAACGSASAGGSTPSASEPDESLRVLLAQIRATVHPGESGSTLKSAQTAADVLDFSLGTDLDAEAIAAQTSTYASSLSEGVASEFAEQLQCIGDAIALLKTDAGQDLLTDAGVNDSAYPWTDEAFARAEALVQAGSP